MNTELTAHHSDYKVDDHGNVYSCKYNKIRKLKPRLSGVGYHMVTISHKGKTSNAYIHHLVYFAFNRDKYNTDVLNKLANRKLAIFHINQDKTDNRLCNLALDDLTNKHKYIGKKAG